MNDKLTGRLSDAIVSDQIFHAYIFISDHREAAESFARTFIKAILTHRRMEEVSRMQEEVPGGREAAICIRVDEDRHEDVIVVRKIGATTRISSIREMQTRISSRPTGDRHLVLIADGDEMNEEAQNALLKTLEEPPGDTVLIIVSENMENLLPTVRSRSIICTVEAEEAGSDEIGQTAAQILDLADGGSGYYRLKKAASAIDDTRDDTRRFIDKAEELCRDRLFTRDEKGIPFDQDRIVADIRALEEARNRLDRGMIPRYVIKELLLKIGG